MDNEEPKTPEEITTQEVNQDQKTRFGMIRTINIVEEVEKDYLDYAMSVIVARALPDVRDGLKPVHRRIFYAMHEMSLTSKSAHKKSARVVGEVLGKYHPHGDQAVYDALVRLAQDFSMRYPLVDGQGNFGSVDGDSAAAMRYTEVRLAKITQEMLADLDKETVEMVDNFDSSLKEPAVMPARLPNLLLMGSEGIAVGMATKIPPHNLGEVVDATLSLIEKGKSPISEEDKAKLQNPETDEPKLLAGHFDSEAQIEDLLTHIKGPDFPTGGEIFDASAIKQMYATGKGNIVVRAIAEIVEKKNDRFQIRVTEIPYQVNKARLIAKIADLVRKKKIEGISDIRDESDRAGMTIAIELKRDAKPKQVLNNLYKQTELQTSFPANFVALGASLTPHVMTLKTILTEYVKHRQLVVIRRSQFDLKEAKARAHILEGLLKALDHIDEIIETIKKSPDADTAKTNLITKFGFSDLQAQAILDMQLRKLAALERQKIQDEYDALMKKIETLINIITHPDKILTVITDELKELTASYGDKRKTKVHRNAVGEFSQEDLIPNEETIITLTQTGYIKRMPRNIFKSQRRGGKGVTGMTTKETDEIKLMASATTHDNLLIFTSKGRVFKLRVWDLPEGSRVAKGQAIVNLINITQDESIQAMLALPENLDILGEQYLFFTTHKGSVKRTQIKAFQNIKSNGLIAIKLASDDQLVWVKQTSGKDHILIVTHHGQSIRFGEGDVRPTGRDTMGVRGITLKNTDYVVISEAFPEKFEKMTDGRRKSFHDILVITQNGIGKRTSIEEYPLQKRSGQGVKVAALNNKTGNIAAAFMVDQDSDQVVITTKEAQAIKLPIKNIPQLKRPTQGVILMRFAKPGDGVVSATALDKETDEESPEGAQ